MFESRHMRRTQILAWMVLAASAARLNAADAPTLLDLGYRQMYNLEFDAAHATFAEHSRETLGGRIADQRGVYRPVSCQVIKGD